TQIDYPGANRTFANAINATGDIVGIYEDPAGLFHGFVLRAGVYSSITIPGASFTATIAIADSGKVLGAYVDDVGVHGFIVEPGTANGSDSNANHNGGNGNGNHFGDAPGTVT